MLSKRGIQFLSCGLNNVFTSVRAFAQWHKIYDGLCFTPQQKDAQQKHATWHVTKQSTRSKNGHIFWAAQISRKYNSCCTVHREELEGQTKQTLAKEKCHIFCCCCLGHTSTSRETSAPLLLMPHNYIYIHVAVWNLNSTIPNKFSSLRLVYTPNDVMPNHLEHSTEKKRVSRGKMGRKRQH